MNTYRTTKHSSLGRCISSIFAMVLAYLLAGGYIHADDFEPTYREKNLKVASLAYADIATNADVLVEPALLIDKKNGFVEIIGESTGMPDGEPVEFALIGLESGHSYESLAISYATPSAVHQALQSIGIPSGEGVDYSQLRVWPRGERVIVEVAPYTTNTDSASWTRLEEFILDDRTDQPLPNAGFVFTGSYNVDQADQVRGNRYAADIQGPHSIISFYNEPQTVLDVPRIAPQSDVYNQQTINPQGLFGTGTLLRIRFTLDPACPIPRGIDLELCVSANEDRKTNQLSTFTYAVNQLDGTSSLTQANLNQLLAFFGTLTQKNHDIFLNFKLDDSLTVEQLNTLFLFFESINKPNGCRISPPDTGQIHYRAFLPESRFLDRHARPEQPWELHLKRDKSSALTGTLVHVEEIWQDQGDTITFKETRYPVDSPNILTKRMEEHPNTLKVVLFFCPPDTTYKEASHWYSYLYPDYRTVYFYPTPQQAATTTGEIHHGK